MMSLGRRRGAFSGRVGCRSVTWTDTILRSEPRGSGFDGSKGWTLPTEPCQRGQLRLPTMQVIDIEGVCVAALCVSNEVWMIR